MQQHNNSGVCLASPLTAAFAMTENRIQLLTAMYSLLLAASVLLPLWFCAAKYWYGRYDRLRVRSTTLVVLLSISGVLCAHAGPGMYVFGRYSFPCWVRSMCAVLAFSLIAANYMLKLVIFYFASLLSRNIAQADRVNDDLFQPDYDQHATGRGRGGLLYGAMNFSRAVAEVVFARRRVMPQNRLILALKFATSRKGMLYVTLVCVALAFVVSIVVLVSRPEYTAGCSGCFMSVEEVIGIAALVAVQLVFVVVFARRAWRFPDPWGLRQELLGCLVCILLIFVGFVGGSFFDFGVQSDLDHYVEICVGLVLMLFTQTGWQVMRGWHVERGNQAAAAAIALKRRLTKHNANGDAEAGAGAVSTYYYTSDPSTPPLTLDALMRNSTLSKAFEEFLIAELSVESLMFIKDTDEWIKAYHSVAPSARLARAKRVFNVYIAINAKFEINVSGTCSRALRELFAKTMTTTTNATLSKVGSMVSLTIRSSRETGSTGAAVQPVAAAVKLLEDVPITVFDDARREITDMLQLGSMMRFRLAYRDSSSLGAGVV